MKVQAAYQARQPGDGQEMRLRTCSDVKWLALITALALVVRIAWILVTYPTPDWDAAVYDGLAWRLAQGDGYVDGQGNPTAFRPVGYPAFLSIIYRIFGHSWLAGYLVNAVLSTFTVVLTYRLARECHPGRIALVAAAAVALFPSHIAYTANMLTESLYTFLALLAMLCVYLLMRQPNWKTAALVGVVLGVGLYVRPTLILFPFVIPLLILLGRKEYSIRRAVGMSCLVLVVALSTIAPWTVRNLLVMGEPILISTNGAYTFWIGNGPEATGEFFLPNDATTAGFTQLDWERHGYRLALQHIVERPAEWLSILPRKFFHLWASDWASVADSTLGRGYPEPPINLPMLIAQAYWVLVVLIAAIAVFSKSPRYYLTAPAVLLLLMFAYWTLFHMIFIGAGRFHMPVIPLVVIVAVHVLAADKDWKSWFPQR